MSPCVGVLSVGERRAIYPRFTRAGAPEHPAGRPTAHHWEPVYFGDLCRRPIAGRCHHFVTGSRHRPLDDEDGRLAGHIDGTIGELSPFYEAFSVYADGSLHTARLPGVLRATAHPSDLLVSKDLAHRTKELSFCQAVVRRGLVDSQVVAERILTAPGNPDEHHLALAALPRDVGRDPPCAETTAGDLARRAVRGASRRPLPSPQWARATGAGRGGRCVGGRGGAG